MVWDQNLLRSLRQTKVVVIHPDDEDGGALCEQLKRIGCRTSRVWPPPQRLPDDADAVFYLIQAEEEVSHPWVVESIKAVRIGIIAYENPVVLEVIAATNAHAVLTKPIRPFGILANLFIARALSRYEERLLARIAKLDEMLKTRRIVERATKILSERNGISEDEAYGLIRREAMRKQLSVTVIAEAIINAEAIFGVIQK